MTTQEEAGPVPAVPKFIEKHPEMVRLLREFRMLMEHNKRFKPDTPQDTMLLFAEGAVGLLALERLVRILLGPLAREHDTLTGLIRLATGVPEQGKPGKPPPAINARIAATKPILTYNGSHPSDQIANVSKVRNAYTHANFERLAREFGATDFLDYFKRQFSSQVHTLGLILDDSLRQVDPATGKR